MKKKSNDDYFIFKDWDFYFTDIFKDKVLAFTKAIIIFTQ